MSRSSIISNKLWKIQQQCGRGRGSYSTKQNIAGAKKGDSKVIMTLKNKKKIKINKDMLTIYKTPDFQVEKRVNEPQNMGQSTLRKKS